LHRIEQDIVQFLEHGQNGLAADRGPTAENCCDLVLRDELSRFFREEGPVRRGVHNDRFELAPKQAALLVLLLDEHEHDIFEGGFADRHRARKRMQNADLDCFLREYGRRRAEHQCAADDRGHRAASADLAKTHG